MMQFIFKPSFWNPSHFWCDLFLIVQEKNDFYEGVCKKQAQDRSARKLLVADLAILEAHEMGIDWFAFLASKLHCWTKRRWWHVGRFFFDSKITHKLQRLRVFHCFTLWKDIEFSRLKRLTYIFYSLPTEISNLVSFVVSQGYRWMYLRPTNARLQQSTFLWIKGKVCGSCKTVESRSSAGSRLAMRVSSCWWLKSC